MMPTQKGGSSSSTAADSSAVQAPAAYMLTLCRLAAGVSVKPPQTSQLKNFKFFTSRSRDSDGNERRYLHMGYFTSVTDAQSWAQLMRRGAYPQAIATRVPAAILNHRDSGVPTLQAAQVDYPPLTDTQVLNILERRSVSSVKHETPDSRNTDIALLRPDDTDTRRILRDAVARNAPVSFTLQLSWSVQPVETHTVPLLSIFRAHTLYRTKGQREGRLWYSLRLGFFADAISAKQVASYVRSSFPSVAVVPITEEERAHANDSQIDTTALTDTFGQQFDNAPHRVPKPATPQASSNSRAATATRDPRMQTLEQTLELLASSEIWDNGDSPSDTGVRHLTIEVQKRPSSR
jgi:hypothetical protein